MSVNALPIDTDCAEQPDGSLLLTVRGELDMATAPVVERALDECLESRSAKVLVDVAEVSFIDATGLRVLNDYRRRLLGSGGDLLLRRPSWQVRRVLATIGERCRLQIAND